jgi:hypothetical protein
MSYYGNQFTDKPSFSNFNYDKGLFLDEKKKRIVDFADMDWDTFKTYKDNFKFVFIISKILVSPRLFRLQSSTTRFSNLYACHLFPK